MFFVEVRQLYSLYVYAHRFIICVCILNIYGMDGLYGSVKTWNRKSKFRTDMKRFLLWLSWNSKVIPCMCFLLMLSLCWCYNLRSMESLVIMRFTLRKRNRKRNRKQKRSESPWNHDSDNETFGTAMEAHDSELEASMDSGRKRFK